MCELDQLFLRSSLHELTRFYLKILASLVNTRCGAGTACALCLVKEWCRFTKKSKCSTAALFTHYVPVYKEAKSLKASKELSTGFAHLAPARFLPFQMEEVQSKYSWYYPKKPIRDLFVYNCAKRAREKSAKPKVTFSDARTRINVVTFCQ